MVIMFSMTITISVEMVALETPVCGSIIFNSQFWANRRLTLTMNHDKFGDSYDIVKQSILRWLSACGTWSVHPMFTDQDPTSYAEAYCCFLGVSAVTTETFRKYRPRDRWIAAGDACQDHLFLDPDTGLRLDEPRGNLNKYLLVCELVTIAKARPKKLTLVFDQSIDRRKKVAGTDEEQIRKKLKQLKCWGVHGFAYRSHANFILVSSDQDALRCAKSTLVNSSQLPSDRFVELRRAGAAITGESD